MRTKVILPGALVALAVAGGCGFADNRRPDVEVPSFEATVRSPTAIDVLTQATEPEELRMIFDEVVEDRSDGDWYEVTILCASVAEEETGVDATLAVGRFANTYRGADEANLAGRDDVTFEVTGRDCEALSSDVPNTVTYEEVRAAVRAAGLRVLGERDGSDACAELGCVDRDVTDQFTVIVWPDGEAAERWAQLVTVDVVRLGPVTTAQLNETGFHPEGEARERYEAAIRGAAPGAASGDLTDPGIVVEPGA